MKILPQILPKFEEIKILTYAAEDDLNFQTNCAYLLEEGISITVPIPSTVPVVPTGYTRTYKMVRVHDGVAEQLDAKVSGNSIVFSSKLFSTYALAYTDEVGTTTTVTVNNNSNEVTNPKTGDNIVMYNALLIVSVIGLGISKKKLMN